MDMGEMMKQAQAMQAKMEQAKAELQDIEVVGEAGAGMVTVKMSGSYACQEVKISPDLFKRVVAGETAGATEGETDLDPVKTLKMVEELVTAAINGAVNKVKEETKNRMSDMANQFGLPPEFKL